MAGPYDVTANRGVLSPNPSTLKSLSSPPSNPSNGTQYYDIPSNSIGVYYNGVWHYAGGSVSSQTLTESSNITWDITKGAVALISITGVADTLSVTGVTVGTPTFGTLLVTHAAINSTLVLPGKLASNFAWAGANIGDVTEVSFFYDGTIFRWVSASYINPPTYDAVTVAFYTATAALGVTLSTAQKGYIDTYVLALKAANVWSKMQAVYPIIGGVASVHVLNLVNPASTDAAFRGVINGTVTHSATGILPVTNGYMDTRFAPTSFVSSTSNHISIYFRQNLTANTHSMGVLQVGFGPALTTHDSVPEFYVQMKSTAGGNLAVMNPNPNSQGLFSGSINGAAIKAHKNGVNVASATFNTSDSVPSNFIWLGACNGTGVFPTNEFCYASIGSGFTDADALAEYNAVQALQTSLGRNV